MDFQNVPTEISILIWEFVQEDVWLFIHFATTGRLGMLQWFVRRKKMDEALPQIGFDLTAEKGHLNVLKYLAENHNIEDTGTAMLLAAESKQIETVAWLLDYFG